MSDYTEHNQKVKPRKATWNQVKAASHRQWPAILAALVPGITQKQLSGKPSPCPACGGDNRFHFTDEGRGCYICRKCADTSRGFPNGFTLIAACLGIYESEAKDRVGDYLGLNGMEAATPRSQPLNPAYQKKSEEQPNIKPTRSPDEIKEIALSILENCDWGLPGYLKNKGFTTTNHLVNKGYFKLPNNQFMPNDTLVAPIQNINDLTETISVQYIPPTGTKKYYITGFEKKNGVIVIPGDDSLPYIAIGTGYATCYSFALAMSCPVFSLFDDTNLVSNCTKVAALFPGKKVLIIGDNDTHKGHTKGQDAAREAAVLTNGLALIPPESGDWDDYRQAHEIEATKAEIERQIKALNHFPIDIKPDGRSNTGLDIDSLITSNNGDKVIFHDALINGIDCKVNCPISSDNSQAIINAGFMFSFGKGIIKPVLKRWHNNEIIDECKAIPGVNSRTKWAINHYTNTLNNKYLYALVWVLGASLGTEINGASFERMLNEYSPKRIKVPADIMRFIYCLVESRIKGARKLTELNLNQFKNRLELKIIHGRVQWEPAQKSVASGKFKMVVIKLQHGMGKTQGFILPTMKHARTLNGGIVHVNRENLAAQIHADIMKEDGGRCLHYKDSPIHHRGFDLSSIGGLVCCIHSLINPDLLNRVPKASFNIFDESSQVLKSLYTDPNIEEASDLPSKISAALKQAKDTGSVLCLVDADHTADDVRHWQEIAGITNDETLIITSQKPIRNLKAKISCSTSQKHFQTAAYNSIKTNIENNVPVVIAFDSEKNSRKMYKILSESTPDKCIVLFTGQTLEGTNIKFNGQDLKEQRDNFIKNIVSITEKVDVFMHNSVMASGISIEHPILKRFKKGYLIISGRLFSATENLQIMRRFRDVFEWEVAFLFCKSDAYMPSFYKNIAAKALNSYGIQQDSIADEIYFTAAKNKALLILAFIGLLRDEYEFEVDDQVTIEEEIPDIMSTLELTEEDKAELINAGQFAPPLEQAKLMTQQGRFKNPAEKIAVAYTMWCDHFKINAIDDDTAGLICTPAKILAIKRLEVLYKILTLDSLIKDVQLKNALLTEAGFTLALFDNQQLTQDYMQELRDSIASRCSELTALREQRLYLLDTKYSLAKNIPDKEIIKFIKKVLTDLGFQADTKRTRANDRERQLVINVPHAIANRLGITIKPSMEKSKQTDRQTDKAEAQRLKALKFSLSEIGAAMNKTKRQAQELLKN